MKASDLRELLPRISSENFVGFKAYDMGRALGSLIYSVMEKATCYNILASLLKGSFLREYVMESSGNGPLLFICLGDLFDKHHKSLKQHFFNVSNIMPNTRKIYFRHTRTKFVLDMGGITTLFLFPLWFFQLRHYPFRFRHKLFLIGHLGQCKKMMSYYISSYGNEIPSFVTSMCDISPFDSLIIQYYCKKGIQTATLEHGVSYLPTDSNLNPQHELTVSDTILVWGKYTRDTAVRCGIEPSHIYIAGNGREDNKILWNPNSSVFCVVLSGEYSEVENNALMICMANKIAKHYNFKYIIKLHPRYNKSIVVYENSIQRDSLEYVCPPTMAISDIAENVRFFISISSTTAYFDLVHMGANVFVYESSINKHLTACFGRLRFDTVDDLIALIEWAENNNEEYRQEVSKIDRYVFAENSTERYKCFYEKYAH